MNIDSGLLPSVISKNASSRRVAYRRKRSRAYEDGICLLKKTAATVRDTNVAAGELQQLLRSAIKAARCKGPELNDLLVQTGVVLSEVLMRHSRDSHPVRASLLSAAENFTRAIRMLTNRGRTSVASN